MILVNIDSGERDAKYHSAKCGSVPFSRETSLKGDGNLKVDGGWLCATTVDGARSIAILHRKNPKPCGHCFRPHK